MKILKYFYIFIILLSRFWGWRYSYIYRRTKCGELEKMEKLKLKKRKKFEFQICRRQRQLPEAYLLGVKRKVNTVQVVIYLTAYYRCINCCFY